MTDTRMYALIHEAAQLLGDRGPANPDCYTRLSDERKLMAAFMSLHSDSLTQRELANASRICQDYIHLSERNPFI